MGVIAPPYPSTMSASPRGVSMSVPGAPRDTAASSTARLAPRRSLEIEPSTPPMSASSSSRSPVYGEIGESKSYSPSQCIGIMALPLTLPFIRSWMAAIGVVMSSLSSVLNGL